MQNFKLLKLNAKIRDKLKGGGLRGHLSKDIRIVPIRQMETLGAGGWLCVAPKRIPSVKKGLEAK